MAKERAKVEEEIVEKKGEPPLNDRELIEIRWKIFGTCPECGENVTNWSPGPFSPAKYKRWEDQGIDGVSGHKQDCPEKWRKA